jgi:hypothetical protein
MTVHADASHGGAMAVDFSAADWAELHQDDIVSTKVVVGLMMSIFTTGLVLYSIVLWAVAH